MTLRQRYEHYRQNWRLCGLVPYGFDEWKKELFADRPHLRPRKRKTKKRMKS